MTTQQLERWRRLSLGLVSAYPRADRPQIRKHVQHCIDWIVDYYALEDIRCWDGNEGDAHLCDRVSDYFYEEGLINDAGDYIGVGTQAAACIRAGFDVAVKPSAGVVGFKVGDLRRVYGGRIPVWVRRWFDPPLQKRARASQGVWL